jgi:hypothetical protein
MSNVFTEADGKRWANKCALCRDSRHIEMRLPHEGHAPECPWCKSVRLKYGSYWYPIDRTNQHLFEDVK